MTATDPPPDDARTRLVEAVAQAESSIAILQEDYARFVEAASASNADDEHDPEGATIAFEREQVGSLLVATQKSRDDALAALAALDAGTYGTCESCGRPIDPARLEARPGARTCIDCARAATRR